MGNVNLRVDGRMIHGQVVSAWGRLLKTDEILVVDDKVAQDPTQVMLLELAVPPGIGFKACSVQEAYELLSTNALGSKNVFVIIKELSSTVELYNKGYRFTKLNIGGIYHDKDKEQKRYEKALFLDDKDQEELKYLIDKGVEIVFQEAPMDRPVDIRKYI